MTVVTTRIIVAADGSISGRAHGDVSPGEHQAAILGAPAPARRRSVREMPRHDLPWDGSVSLRREDLYDENGRLLEHLRQPAARRKKAHRTPAP